MKDGEKAGGTDGAQGMGGRAESWHGFGREGRETLSGGWTEGEDGRVVLGGRYCVVRRLGDGGMGSVWLAEDLKLDGRKVAVKMLPAVLAGKKGAFRQVKQEAMVAMKLSHPNIVTVRAFEEDEAGTPFLVMDYIDGETLDEVLSETGPLGEERTRKLLGPVAAALDYAHGKGVVHRDVKPENVIVAKDGTPYVLDFGIAREVQETMTRMTGKLSSGTLLYMSPEQMRGRVPKAAQDVYSFAAMVYECLTGAPPFSRGQVEWQILNEPPEPLGEGVAGAALRAGVMAGLAKAPVERPGSCTAVLGQAGNLGSGGAGHAKGGAGKRAAAGWRAWAWLAAAALLAGAVIWGMRLRGGGAEAEGERAGGGVGMEEAGVPKRAEEEGGPTASVEEAEGVGEPSSSVEAAEEAEEEGEGDGGEGFALPVKTVMFPGRVELEMVWCPVGGGGVWMGKTEVTQAQWESVMGANPSHFKGRDLPVESVSWNDCRLFVERLNRLPCSRANGLTFRLPTDAEWRAACLAGGKMDVDFYRLADGTEITAENLDRVAWAGENWNMGSTHPVGQKEPNAWGLHDMFGNVWEWTQTAKEGKYASRGSGVFNPAENYGGWRTLNLEWPEHACQNHGFRLAADGESVAK